MTIGERIRARRYELSMSVETLSQKTGKNRATIYRYESNDIENMPADVLIPLAEALDTTPGYLMGWEDTPIINLSKKEEKLVTKYRENPSMQKAVDILLGIEE